ncbi:ATP-binding protein [Clostridium botulinum]|nr:ATP-binding protein [Clostridium botulinum]
MKLEKIDINNFRKLFEEVNIDIDFETLVVGKNNTGKTSIFEVVDKFLSGGSSFKFEDFSSHTITSNYIN